MRTLIRLIALTLLAALPLATAAYPTKPVRLIIPFPPGGASDYVGRAVAQSLSELWGQNVVPDHRGGSGATIRTGLGTKSPATRHTPPSGLHLSGRRCGWPPGRSRAGGPGGPSGEPARGGLARSAARC